MINDSIIDEILILNQTKSFSKAAEYIGMSQPTLSLRIKKVEAELGCQIFNRDKELEITQEGLAVLEYLQKRKQLDANLQAELVDLSKGYKGLIRVGSTMGFAQGIIPKYISEFQKDYPNINIRMVEADMQSIKEYAKKGEVDLFLSSDDTDKNEFELDYLFSEKLLLCMPPDSINDVAFRDKIIYGRDIKNNNADYSKKVRLKDISQKYKYIVMPQTKHVGILTAKIIKDLDIDNNDIIIADQMTTAFAMAQYNMGITFITEDYVKYTKYIDDVPFAFIDSEYSTRNVYMTYAKEKYHSKAMKLFLEFVERRIKEKWDER